MMDDLLYRLWGKTNERGPRDTDWKWQWHPAVCHMIDVAYAAATWLELVPALMDRFVHLAGAGYDREDLRRVMLVLIALHDLGKVHPGFQAKSEEGWKVGYGGEGIERPDDAGSGFDHGRASAVIARRLGFDWLEDWGRSLDAIAAHHGTFYTASQVDPDTSSIGVDRRTRLIGAEAVGFFAALFELPDPVPPAPESPGFGMLLAGFCSVADWLGSDATAYTYAADVVSSRPTAEHYYRRLCEEPFRDGLPRAEWQLRRYGLLSRFNVADASTRSLFAYIDKPRALQELAESIPFGGEHGPEMLVVEAPMGMGKTEIALLANARGLQHGTAGGLYVAMPTQASADALLERVALYAGAVAESASSVSISLAHGGRRFNARFAALVERTAGNFNRLEENRSGIGAYHDSIAIPSEVIAPEWLAGPKQMLLAGIGVGSVDQAMMGAIAVKHHFVRLFALAGKVVVFDEIHAYDSYMNAVIVHLLRWLYVLGAKVVLLSATLPRRLRSELLRAYGASDAGATGATAECDPYPQIVHRSPAGGVRAYVLPRCVTDAETAAEIPIVVRTHAAPHGERTRAGAERALELASGGGCIAWIRNTVREAQEAWSMLRDMNAAQPEHAIRIVMLHARYTRADRSMIQDELIESLGRAPARERPERLIVIATQVIEQSVDMDFDAMISDLAPLDLLLQRAGRLWRHIRSIEERRGHRERMLHVLAPEAEELYALNFGGSGHVYDPEVLARSAELLGAGACWRPTADCRPLVAGLYDSDAAPNVDPDALERVRRRRRKEEQAMRERAGAVFCARPNSAMDFSTGPLRRDNDDAIDVELATRYGGNSAALVLLCRDERGRLCLQGRPEAAIEPLPAPRDYRSMLALEHAVALSTISFPWYGPLECDVPGNAAPAPLAAWWRERHPYDDKLFLLMEPDGRLRHPQFTARYGDGRSALEGLVFEEVHRRATDTTMRFEEC